VLGAHSKHNKRERAISTSGADSEKLSEPDPITSAADNVIPEKRLETVLHILGVLK
jgi:hypothetical protein